MSAPTPPFVRTPEENFAGLDDFPFAPNYFEVDGLRMHYLDEGRVEGPVALLLHGMPTWSYLYRSVIPVLQDAGFRCIAPDHIGFGRSDKVTDPAWYDIARHTSNLARLISALDLRDITIFVQDWGGPIGLAQVCNMPERFSRLVIMNTWLHHGGYEYTPAIRNWIAQNEPGGIFRDSVPVRFGWGTLMVVGTRRGEPHEALFPLLQGGQASLSLEATAVRDAYDAPFAGLDEPGVTGPRQFPLCIPFHDHDHDRGSGDLQASHFSTIDATTLPVNFVWGGSDDIFPPTWGRQWHERIAHSTWDVLDHAGHFLQDTHGARVAEIVLRRAGH